MRSNTKKNQIYEIHVRKAPIITQKTVLLPNVRYNIQNVVSNSNALPTVTESVIEPFIEPVIETVTESLVETVTESVIETIVQPLAKCVENETNNLQYVKSKIMLNYNNLYKSL